MTAVLDRPTETGGGVPARRAVLRWALRLFRREWHQQLLVLTLITVAVAATIFGAALGTNLPLPANLGVPVKLITKQNVDSSTPIG